MDVGKGGLQADKKPRMGLFVLRQKLLRSGTRGGFLAAVLPRGANLLLAHYRKLVISSTGGDLALARKNERTDDHEPVFGDIARSESSKRAVEGEIHKKALRGVIEVVGDGDLIKAVFKRVGVDVAAPHTRAKAAKRGIRADFFLAEFKNFSIDYLVGDLVLFKMGAYLAQILADTVGDGDSSKLPAKRAYALEVLQHVRQAHAVFTAAKS